MIKKLTRNLLSTILTVLLAVGVFGIAAPKEVHAAGGGITVTASRNGNTYKIFEDASVNYTITKTSFKNIVGFSGNFSSNEGFMSYTGSGVSIINATEKLRIDAESGSGTLELKFQGTTYWYTINVKGPHTHTWNNNSYSASGNKITATCQGSGTCDLTQPTLTLNASGKTYDGSAVTATLTKSDTWKSENLPTPTITYNPVNSKNVGTYTASAKVGNATASQSFTITPKEIGLTWGTSTFTYDGHEHAPTATISGVVSGDTCNVSVGGAQVNAGEYTATASLTGANAGNYKLPDDNTKDFTINKKLIDLTDVLANSKVYDSTTDADLDAESASLSGVIEADKDDVSIGLVTGSYDNKNVGTNKSIQASATLTGDKSSNYEVNPLDLTADITPKTVTVTEGVTAEDKDYDKNKTATVDASGAIIDGKIKTDTLAVSAEGNFSDANVGNNKVVYLSNYSLSGTDAGNYELAQSGNQATTTASIKAVPMDVVATGYEGTYDGSAHHITVTVNDPSDPNEHVVLYKGPNDSEYVHHHNPGFTDPGEYIVYYKVTSSNHITKEGSATVKITGATFEGITSKGYSAPYDRDSHDITVAVPDTYDDYTITYSTEENGTYSTDEIEFTDFTDGAKTVYYKVSKTGFYDFKGSNTVNITKIPVTVNGIEANNKVYDGNTDATLNFDKVVIDGKLQAEVLNVTATGTFADKDAEVGKTVTISNIVLSGDAAKNYELASSGNQTEATATISKKQITVSGITSVGKIYDDKPDATESLKYEGVQFNGIATGDKLAISATGTFVSTDVGKDIIINLSDYVLSGDDVANYELATTGNQTTTKGDISTRYLTITIHDKEKFYGEADPKFTYDAQGYIYGDHVTGSPSRVAGEDVGVYTITKGSIDATYNYAMDLTVGKLTIKKATSNSVTVSIDGWTYGSTPNKPTATATHGAKTATFTYSNAEDGEYTDTVPTDAGTYYVKANIANTNNYPEATSDPVAFTIAPKELTLEWGKDEFIYNGTAQKPTATLSGFVGDDTCEVTVSGERTNSNIKSETEYYVATATIDSNIKNYVLPSNNTVNFTIAPKQLDHDMLELEPLDTIEADPSGKEVGPDIVMDDPDIEEEVDGDLIAKEMIVGEDYTLSGTTVSNKYGTHNITVTGKGNYTGTIETSWILLDKKPDIETERVGDNSFIEIFVTIEGNTESISAPGFTMDLVKTLITDDEMKWLEEEDGEKITVYLEVIEEPIDIVKDPDEDLILDEFKKLGATDIRWFDIKVWKKDGKNAAEEIHNIKEGIEMIIEVPDDYKKARRGYNRFFYLATYHDGEDFAEILINKTGSTNLTFTSDRFSTFAIAYKDLPIPDNRRLPKTGVE